MLVLQDMLRDEFGIGQLGKRLKLLEAGRDEAAAKPKPKTKSKPKKSRVPKSEPATELVKRPAGDSGA